MNARRLRKLGNVDMKVWKSILKRDPCVYCYGPADTVDHIHPRARGGITTVENVAPACVACNGRKRDMPLLMFLVGCAPQKRSRKAERRERDARQKTNRERKIDHAL